MTSVAIVIPVYATTEQDIEWLLECLSSCENAGADEIILWNDGSTVDLDVSAYRVTVLGAEHKGKSYARNHAVDAAHTELIYPVDADDTIAAGTVTILKNMWKGTPLYSDLYKVHGTALEYWPVLPFKCEHVAEKSVSTVNVLHSREQWRTIGGWNETLNLYEDWEYNARLFWMYGAERVAQPLVYYRQHMGQSTKTSTNLQKNSAVYTLKQYVKEFKGRFDMGCCGKRRTASASNATTLAAAIPSPHLVSAVGVSVPVTVSVETDVASLGDPGPGNVWARYVGGSGMGPHDRRGSKSRKKYIRISYGQVYAVKAQDAVSEDEFSRGAPNCGFIQLRQMQINPSPPPAPSPTSVRQMLSRTPSVPVVREPLREEPKDSDKDWATILPTMSVAEIRNVLADLSTSDVERMIVAEERAEKSRASALKVLSKELASRR